VDLRLLRVGVPCRSFIFRNSVGSILIAYAPDQR
jgi:hypothetical protein